MRADHQPVALVRLLLERDHDAGEQRHALPAALREVLGDKQYESLLSAGESMTNVAIVTYAFEQIDIARAHLLRADKSP